MATQYARTALPDEGIKIKRGPKHQDGTFTFEVYAVKLEKVGQFKGEPFSGRRIYKTDDGEVFSTAEAAADHVVSRA